jgi:hypothetical protein
MEKLFEFTSLERERTWERHMTRFHHLELMSYLSRLWNFNQTGDLRVIPYKVFKAFRVYKQFLKTNWVSFKNIATFDLIPRDDRPMLALSPHRIPIDPETGKPILSADSSLAYHYDAKMGQVRSYYIYCCIALITYLSYSSIERTRMSVSRP